MGVGLVVAVAVALLGAVGPVEAGHLVVSVSDGKYTLAHGAYRVGPVEPDVLTVLDASSFPPRIVAEIPVRHSVIGPPTGVALTPDEKLALVSMPSVVDPADRTRIVAHAYLQVIDLDASPATEITKVPLPAPPMGLSVNRAGDLALVAHLDGTVSVLAIAGKRVRAVGTVTVGNPRSEVCHVAISPDGRWALATKRAEGTVAVLAIDAARVTYTGRDVTAGSRPCVAEVSGDGRVAVVGNVGRAQGDADTVTLIDMTRAPLRSVATVVAGSTPEGLAISPDSRWLVVNVMNGSNTPANSPFHSETGKVILFALTRAGATRVAAADTGRNAQGVTFTPDGKYVLVQNYVEQELAVYTVSPTAIEDTGVRLKTKGSPASIRIAPR
jgi:DNA-binding beta-propeller fold protein YncE